MGPSLPIYLSCRVCLLTNVHYLFSHPSLDSITRLLVFRVASVPGAVETLMAGGFELDVQQKDGEEDTFLVVPGSGSFLPPAVKILFERLDQILVQLAPM